MLFVFSSLVSSVTRLVQYYSINTCDTRQWVSASCLPRSPPSRYATAEAYGSGQLHIPMIMIMDFFPMCIRRYQWRKHEEFVTVCSAMISPAVHCVWAHAVLLSRFPCILTKVVQFTHIIYIRPQIAFMRPGDGQAYNRTAAVVDRHTLIVLPEVTLAEQ